MGEFQSEERFCQGEVPVNLESVNQMVRSLEGAPSTRSVLESVSAAESANLSVAKIVSPDTGFVRSLIKRANEIQEANNQRADQRLTKIEAERLSRVRQQLDQESTGDETRVDLKALIKHCNDIGISSEALLQAYYENTNNETYEENLAKQARLAGLSSSATVAEVNRELKRQEEETDIARWAYRLKFEIPGLVDEIRENPLKYPDREMPITRDSYSSYAVTSKEALHAFSKSINSDFFKVVGLYSVPFFGQLALLFEISEGSNIFPSFTRANPSKPKYSSLIDLQNEARKHGAEIQFSLEPLRGRGRLDNPNVRAVLRLKPAKNT